jgi:hypothetical protein
VSAASEKAREQYCKIGTLVAAYTAKHKMCEDDRQLLRQMLGYVQPTNSMLACDLTLRRRAGKNFGDILVAVRKEDPSLHFYFWTIIHTIGNTSDRQPEINIKGMQSLADKAFRRFNMDSLSVFEIQGLTNYPQRGEGRILMAHIHGVSWTRGRFDHEAAMELYRSSPAWPKPFGADPVDIQVIKGTNGDLRRVAYYMFKPPYDAKVHKTVNGRIRLLPTEKGYRPEFAMRILEGLSQLEVKLIVRATGAGSRLRKDLFRRLTYRHRSRMDWKPGYIDTAKMTDFWNRYRTKKRQKTYLPYTVKR